jgi:hypothetical protein
LSELYIDASDRLYRHKGCVYIDTVSYISSSHYSKGSWDGRSVN